MIESFANYATDFFLKWNYPAAVICMAMESMVLPVPSEIVMPPIGMLVSQNKLNLVLSIIFTSFGSIIGSMISYYMGYFGGKPFVHKFGKYLFLNIKHLELTEKWFHKHGKITIFIGRFIPVVRHLISIPAGIGKMKLPEFLIYTITGATIWNSFLLWVGMKLGEHWQLILKYRNPIDIGVIVIMIGFVIYFFYSHILPARKKEKI